MWGGVLANLLLLARGSSTATAVHDGAPRLLVAFRPLSRNLEGFRGHVQALGLAELSSRENSETCALSSALSPASSDHHDVWYYRTERLSTCLIAAASSSVLLHGLYEVIVDATSAESAALAVARNASALSDDVGRPWALAWNEHHGTKRRNDDGRRRLKQLTAAEKNERLRPIRNTLTAVLGAECEVAMQVATTKLFALELEPRGRVVLGRRLAYGLACDPTGTVARASRRPRAGALGALALHRRTWSARWRVARAPTMMEPEIGLLMANLAGLGGGGGGGGDERGRVLDPFCGGGGLLLPAAYLLSRRDGLSWRMVGHDVSMEREDQEHIRRDFAELGLPAGAEHLELGKRNVLRWQADRSSDGRLACEYDAIICDPPYGVKATAHTATHAAGVEERTDSVWKLLEALLALADAALAPSGRLVLFAPEPFEPARTNGHHAALPPLPEGLRIRGSYRQEFASRRGFVRHLVVVERRGLRSGAPS